MKIKEVIPIFYAVDNNYIDVLAVSIKSLVKNSSKENIYNIIILNNGLNEQSKKYLKTFETENIQVCFEDINDKISKIKDELELRLRDYYSNSIFYRLFIPGIFKEFEKAIYLDCDTIVRTDIAKLFKTNIQNYELAVIQDEVARSNSQLRRYVKIAVGIDSKKYFNSGVLLMNLRNLRKNHIEEKFIYLLKTYNLDTIAPDQDYLNILCKGKVKYLNESWDAMPDYTKIENVNDINLIHFNMFRKPWHYKNVKFEDEFWKYAKQTKYYDRLQDELKNYTEKQKEADEKGAKSMVDRTVEITWNTIKFADVIDDVNSIDFDNTNVNLDETSDLNGAAVSDEITEALKHILY